MYGDRDDPAPPWRASANGWTRPPRRGRRCRAAARTVEALRLPCTSRSTIGYPHRTPRLGPVPTARLPLLFAGETIGRLVVQTRHRRL